MGLADLQNQITQRLAKEVANQRVEIEKFYRENTDNPIKKAEAVVAKLKKAHDDAKGASD